MNGVLWMAWLFVAWLTLTTLGQAIFTVHYLLRRRVLRRGGNDLSSAGQVAVVMAIRGGDAGLQSVLAQVDQLDYRDYEIHLVVDHHQDSAGEICRKFQAEAQHVVLLHVPHLPRHAGGLKNDRLLWALEKVSSISSHVLFVDADVRVYPQLLSDLLEPFSDSRVVCSGGSRWYEVAAGGWPERVRSILNAAAVVQMDGYGVPWGGTWLWRRDVLGQAELRQIWSESFCEDVSVVRWLRRFRYRLARPVSAVLINRENVTWTALQQFWTRQLLCARLYHWAWPAILVHALNGFLMTGLAVIGSIICLFCGQPFAAGWVVLGLTSYIVISAWLMKLICRTNEQWLVGKGDFQQARGIRLWWNVCWAIPVSQWLHAKCAWRAATMQQVEWRQIRYRIAGGNVERLNYQAFQDRE